jgi:hypothetical protein
MFLSRSKIKRATISAKIIRADGTVEDLGVIASKEPIWGKIKRFFFKR